MGTSVTGNFGSITIAANGSYTYTVDNSNATVQALRTAADMLTDTFTYSFVDASGAQSTAQITVTIHGADDTAVPTDDSGNAVEAGGVNNTTVGSNATGNVLANDSDVDAGDTQTVVGVAAGSLASAAGSVGSSVTGLYGAVTINADGSYTYVVNEANSTVQALRTSGQRSAKSLLIRNKHRRTANNGLSDDPRSREAMIIRWSDRYGQCNGSWEDL